MSQLCNTVGISVNTSFRTLPRAISSDPLFGCYMQKLKIDKERQIKVKNTNERLALLKKEFYGLNVVKCDKAISHYQIFSWLQTNIR